MNYTTALKEALRLSHTDLDWKQVALQLAVMHPASFVKVAGPRIDEQMNAAYKELGGQKIPLLKRYRELTGCGLREAKEYIEAKWSTFLG